MLQAARNSYQGYRLVALQRQIEGFGLVRFDETKRNKNLAQKLVVTEPETKSRLGYINSDLFQKIKVRSYYCKDIRKKYSHIQKLTKAAR